MLKPLFTTAAALLLASNTSAQNEFPHPVLKVFAENHACVLGQTRPLAYQGNKKGTRLTVIFEDSDHGTKGVLDSTDQVKGIDIDHPNGSNTHYYFTPHGKTILIYISETHAGEPPETSSTETSSAVAFVKKLKL